MTVSEMREYIIDYFHLTEEDCSLRTKSGNATQVADRLNWVRQYLRRALMIELPQRGVYRITQRGKEYLATHKDLRRITQRGKEYLATHKDLRKQDLMQYPEFASYATGVTTTSSNSTKVESGQDIVNQDLTPTEQLEQAFHSIIDDLAADLLQKTLEQSPYFFEHLVMASMASSMRINLDWIRSTSRPRDTSWIIL